MRRHLCSHGGLVLFAALSLCTTSSANAAPFAFSWLGGSGAPCKNIGVHGAFRVFVSGEVATNVDGSRTVSKLAMHVGSAAIQANPPGMVSGAAVAQVGGAAKSKVTLTRPSVTTIEATPKPDESSPLYLPKSLVIPKGGDLWVEASALVKTASGACPLGASRSKVPL